MKSRFLVILERDKQTFFDRWASDFAVYEAEGQVVVVEYSDFHTTTRQDTFDTPAQAEAYLQSLGVDTDSIGWY